MTLQCCRLATLKCRTTTALTGCAVAHAQWGVTAAPPIQTARQAQTHTAVQSSSDPDHPWPAPTQARVSADLSRSSRLRRESDLFILMYLFFSFVWLSLVFKPWLFLYPDIPAGAGYLSGPRIWTMPLEDELTTAAAKGDAAQVRILLGSGAQVNGVNRFGCTALQVSVMFPNFYCRRWRSRQTAHAFLDAPLDSYQVH